MDMESSRRSFDRSREPGIKKPRLNDEPERSTTSSVRLFPQRQVAAGVNTLVPARFRTNDRDSESNDSGRGGYQSQPLLHQELVTQYKTALAELTFNSKPIITNLTIIAGENLYAAKAIAATVCANILEVPSEQKLPSLYLLDSIVKNIGRDYIKYFAARLPEVFCKAYRQVDSSVHSSMRHLFGTWKGVFPLQTLQIIEKELGFTPAVNGSSSTSTAVRSDLQSPCPPHSIHVNPKYLERQRLQQSNRTKGIANDMAGAIANSAEVSERPDRTLGAPQPWVDPSVNMHRSHRDASNDSVPQKAIGGSYGGSEYGPDLPRNSGLGIGRTGGRVSELGHDKAWYKGGRGVETVSAQRNGFNLKHGFSNHEAPKSMNLEAHNQPAQSITSLRSNVLSSSWKNSEEEEFMWDEMDAGLSDCGASNDSNNLSKDRWAAADENLAVEDHLQIVHDFGSKFDGEISAESLSTEQKQHPAFEHSPSSSWQLQEQHSIDKLNRKPDHSEGFATTLGGLPICSNSSLRMGKRPVLSNATKGSAGMVGLQQFHPVGAESPSGQSPLRQKPSSPPVTMLHPPHQLRNLAEQDSPPNLKTSHFSGLQSQYIQDSLPVLPPNVQVGNLRRSQQKDVQGSLSSVTSFQPRLHNVVSKKQQLSSSQTEASDKAEKPFQPQVSPAGETLEQSTTSSLLAAVMKSGIFSNNSITSALPTTSFLDTKNLPSQLGVRPARPSGPSTSLIASGPGGASPSSLGPSNVDLSILPKVSQGKVEQPTSVPDLPLASSTLISASAQTSDATNNKSNPISNLLSSLVAKGLISAKAESSTKVPAEILTRLDDQSQSITTSCPSPVASVSGSATAPISPTRGEVDHAAKSSVSLSQSPIAEIRNLIGFEFKPDVIRELHPTVIRELLDDFPHHCSVCGLRLKHLEQFNRHLGSHATSETEHGLRKASRRWYAKSSNWIAGKAEFFSDDECTDSVDACAKKTDQTELDAIVPADENQCLCVLCGELFEDIYCQERDKWMFKGAVYSGEIGVNVSTARGPIVHAKCLTESSISCVTKMELD